MNHQTNKMAAAKFALKWAQNLPSLLVTAGGGTGNVLAGQLANFLGVSYNEAHTLLESVNPDWYASLFYHHGGWHCMDWGSPCNVRGLYKALKRRFQPLYDGERWDYLDQLAPRKGFWAYK